MQRAGAGFLRADSICPRTHKHHKLQPNQSETGMKAYCGACHAGIAPKLQREQIAKDITTATSDLRFACWMCGGPFSKPRTKDEYLQQLCAVCLTLSEGAGLLKLEDPRTREVGKDPSFSAHIV